MKLEVITFAITGFLILNTYYDGKYTKILMLGRKYFKMIMYAFIGFSVYLFMKRNPDDEVEAHLKNAFDKLCFQFEIKHSEHGGIHEACRKS